MKDRYSYFSDLGLFDSDENKDIKSQNNPLEMDLIVRQNQRFFINSQNEVCILFEDQSNHCTFHVPIPSEKFFEKGTLHITHMDNGFLNGEKSEMVTESNLERLEVGYIDNMTIIGSCDWYDDCRATIYSVYSDDRPIGFSKIRALMEDKCSALYKAATENLVERYHNLLFVNQFSIGNYYVLELYTRSYGEPVEGFYALFDKADPDSEPVCVPAAFSSLFKPGVDWKEVIKKEMQKDFAKAHGTLTEADTAFINSYFENMPKNGNAWISGSLEAWSLMSRSSSSENEPDDCPFISIRMHGTAYTFTLSDPSVLIFY